MKRIASVAVMAGERLLIGKRSDDGRWNLPGGHVDEGESPEQGAVRELKEETGIDVDADRLLQLRMPHQVTTYTGKQIEVYSYLLILPELVAVHREGTDPGEAHDWSWTNVTNGLPPDVAQNWHNKTDATLEALGLKIVDNPSMTKCETDEDLLKAWPREYNRVKGQTKEKGVASKKQLRYMKARAAQGDQDAKDYVKNTGDGGGLPEEGTGGMRGERERGRHEKRKGREKTEKAEDRYEEKTALQIKRQHRPKVTTFGEQVDRIKAKYAEKKPKSFAEQVASVKARYKKPMEKASDLFYAKVEGLLEKGTDQEELLSNMMDIELILRDAEDEASLEGFYKSADRLFDAAMSPEEQTVYELAYLAKSGCEVSLEALEKFTVEMYDELLKNVEVEDVVGEMVAEALGKSNYGPKKIGDEKVSLYNEADNVGRKMRRVGDVYEDAGKIKAAYKYTPSAHGTMNEQATRQAKADQKKSKANPVKVYTPEELAAFQAKYEQEKTKKKDVDLDEMIDEHEHLVDVLDSPSHEDDKKESKKQKKELAEYKRERAEKSEDNSRVVGKKNGHSVRKVHGYYRYTSGPKRGEYVHRHEAEKRLGRKLSSKEHVDHKDGNRGSTKNTKVMSASAHAAKTNSTRANSKGYSGGKRYEHTRD